MKKTAAALFLMCVAVLGSGFLRIGDAVPEIAKGHWVASAPVRLGELKGKKMAALLFWSPDTAGVRGIQSFLRTVRLFGGRPVVFAAVGRTSAEALMKFPPAQQLRGIPLLADVSGHNEKLFLRAGERLPVAVLIGKDGRLLWRGAPGRLASVLSLVEKGKYDQEKVRHDDDFRAAFAALVGKSDFKGALALLEKELDASKIDPREIVALQVGIHYRRLNSPEGALESVHRAQKRFPGDVSFYEMELKLLELGRETQRMNEFYYRLTSIFKDQPRILLNFVTHEMNRPVEQMVPANVYIVARAAANAGKFRDDREKGRALIFYAQSLYCLGRVELAAKVAEKALKVLKGTPDYDRAAGVAGFYRKLVDFSPKIKE